MAKHIVQVDHLTGYQPGDVFDETDIPETHTDYLCEIGALKRVDSAGRDLPANPNQSNDKE